MAPDLKMMRRLIPSTRLVLGALVGVAVAGAARPTLAQSRLCAGRPCDRIAQASDSAAESTGHRGKDPTPRAVLVDAVVLTPALEKANARLGIEQAVTTAVRQAGWEPVAVNADCKDLGCAGAAAAAAKATYAIVLTGRFVKQETYVADIGVSLSRDGSVIAARTEAQEQAAARRTGSEFRLCGPPSGVCTAKLLANKLQQYATQLLEDENISINVRRRIAAEMPPTVEPAPAPSAPPILAAPQPAPSAVIERPGHRRLGWSLVIGGGVLAAGGVTLWAIDGSGADCHSVVGDKDSCRSTLKTRPAGIAAGLVGLAAAGAGVALLRLSSGGRHLSLTSDGRGFSLGGGF